MIDKLTDEQETVRSVFGAYINDLKAYSSKPDRPMFRRLEEVRDKAIKALEQENVLETIRAEIEKKRARAKQMSSVLQMNAYTDCLQIIDKYKAESEDTK